MCESLSGMRGFLSVCGGYRGWLEVHGLAGGRGARLGCIGLGRVVYLDMLVLSGQTRVGEIPPSSMLINHAENILFRAYPISSRCLVEGGYAHYSECEYFPGQAARA